MSNIKPEVGQGVTVGVGSDRYPATIILVSKSRKRVTIQYDTATPAEGFDYFSNQVYNYERNKEGRVERWSLRNDGRWLQIGVTARNTGAYLSLNGRNRYSDPSF